jgi:hypothetical protein
LIKGPACPACRQAGGQGRVGEFIYINILSQKIYKKKARFLNKGLLLFHLFFSPAGSTLHVEPAEFNPS